MPLPDLWERNAARAWRASLAPPPPPRLMMRRIGDASWQRFALQKDAAISFGIARSEVSHLVNDRSKAAKKSLLFEARLVTVVSSGKCRQKRRREAPVAAAPTRQSSRVRKAVSKEGVGQAEGKP